MTGERCISTYVIRVPPFGRYIRYVKTHLLKFIAVVVELFNLAVRCEDFCSFSGNPVCICCEGWGVLLEVFVGNASCLVGKCLQRS